MAERDKSKNKIPALAPDLRMKKRGRPPLMLSHPSLRGRGRGRPPSPSRVLPNIVSNVETGTGFVPYQLTVNVGEDLLDKVSTFAKTSSLTVCVLSAVGSISRVAFRKPGPPSTATVTWEGRFEILSLSGNYTFVPGQEDAYGEHNCWNLAISDCNGAVFGGSVVGPMIVASPVDLILATFELKSTEKMRRHACATAAAAVAGSKLVETDTETLSDKYPTVDGKKCRGSPTSELSSVTPKTDDQASESVTPKATDKPSESVTPKTIDKTSESVTPKTIDKTSESVTDKTSESVTTPKTTDKPTESVTSTTKDYSMNSCIDDAEKAPGEDPNGEGEKESDCSPTSRFLATDKPAPESVTPKTTDKPQEELSSETVDKPPEDVTPATSDKPPEDVTPATSSDKAEDVTPITSSDKPPENVSTVTTTKSPENVVAATSDTSLPVLICCFDKAPEEVPMTLQL